MIDAILRTTLKTLFGPMLSVAALGTQVQGEVTNIKIENCEKSKHEVRLDSFANKKTTVPDDSAKIHSGEAKTVYCNSSQCYLVFTSGADTSTKHTSASPWYVHVKSNHTFSISDAPSLCD